MGRLSEETVCLAEAVDADLADVEPGFLTGNLEGSGSSISQVMSKSGSGLSGRAGRGERPISGIRFRFGRVGDEVRRYFNRRRRWGIERGRCDRFVEAQGLFRV